MTCIVLVQNPQRGGILAITEGDENDQIAQWPDHDSAAEAMSNHTLVRAWGGYVVDLDNMEVRSI